MGVKIEFVTRSAIASLLLLSIANSKAEAREPQVEKMAAVESSRSMAVELRIKNFHRPATTLKEWEKKLKNSKLITQNAPVSITRVQVNRVDSGLDVVLETEEGKPLSVDATNFRSEGNSLIADIPNAVLALPDGKEFQADNPIADIANVRVTQLAATSIRVSVTGNNALPTSEVTLRAGALAYSLNPEGEDPDEEELTVTGTSTATPNRDVPFSVQVIPSTLLQQQAPLLMQEALRNVSGVSTSTRANYGFIDNFYVRGFQAEFLRDGIPDQITPVNTERSGLFRGFADVERIEVLKGPAGALYGVGASGDNVGAGLINLITFPFTTDFVSKVSLSGGSFERFGGTFNLSGPIDQKVLYRFDGGYESREGFRKLNLERLEILPSIQLKLDPNNTVTLDFDYRNIKARPDIPGIPFLPGVNGSIISGAHDRLFSTPFSKADQEIYRLGLKYELQASPDLVLTNNFYYTNRQFDLIRNATDVVAYNVTPSAQLPSGVAIARRLREQTDSNEGFFYRLDGKLKTRFLGMDHQILTGVEFNRTASDTIRYQVGNIGSTAQSNNPTNVANGNAVCNAGAAGQTIAPGQVVNRLPCIDSLNPVFSEGRIVRRGFGQTGENINESRDSTNRTIALFLQDQISFSEQFKALLGARLDFFNEQQTRRPGDDSLATTATDRSYEQNVTRFNPRFGFVYQPDKVSSFYASYASSFASNGAIARGPNANRELVAIPIATINQYEVGYKGTFFDNNLVATLALFQIDRKDVVSRLDVNNNPTDPVDQRSRGVELDLRANLNSRWTLNFNYAYIDAITTRGVPLSLDPILGILAPARTGQRITGVPKHSFNVWTAYQASQNWTIGLGANYQDDRFANQDGTGILPSYLALDAFIGYRVGGLEAQINFRNLTNTEYFPGGGRGSATPSDPFSVYATVGYRF
ncbi:TonB-dependent receptor [Phormidium sp. CLA17]|uniref:TonB-dependent receptor domain-containing protein n=1 Tax=Leptolyngbya sp. Cla-17 TaxID=2803751 RepID=UPI00149161EA|nr:TonB-dependent receptor [Leptolyngbya sp. Cla-17]MBM0744119.1 TonB-dependent receptor [Leptolyngbya sp. Cla-17]